MDQQQSIAIRGSIHLDSTLRVAPAAMPPAAGVARPGLLERLVPRLLVPVAFILHAAGKTYSSFRITFELMPPRAQAWLGALLARGARLDALSSVPAYREFAAAHASRSGEVPETDKESYIKSYPIGARCRGGVLPHAHIMIDESSGSTGTPYNWVRGDRERSESHRQISHFVRYACGRGPWITINAFSMGAWATGINMGTAMLANSPVKNTGPDIDKILGTLEFLGPDRPYLITGYPPFLKHLIDVANARGFPFDRYRLTALVGGEGMSEGLRDYLRTRFEGVYSGYGATDLEIGMAGETPLSVAIRRLARDDARVRASLFGRDSRLPMLFQYNPLMHHLETNAAGELVCTVTRTSLVSPRIRYNVHDEGGVARYDEMAVRLADAGVDMAGLQARFPAQRVRFPFVWIYGRSDHTISVMGANIYPEDLEQCLYAEPELARVTRSFCLAVCESETTDVRPCFMFEVTTPPGPDLQARFASAIPRRLVALNADYREACNEYPDALVPRIELYPAGTGPFARNAGKIKQTRLVKVS